MSQLASFSARIRFIFFSIILLTTGTSNVLAVPNYRIKCSTDLRHQVPSVHQHKLAGLLQRITGFTNLSFTPGGVLNVDTDQYSQGSATARDVIQQAISADATMEIQNHPRSESINFGQFERVSVRRQDQPDIEYERWEIRLDFNDFAHMEAPPEVRESFNEGFVFLHEVLHGLGKNDTKQIGEIGECEEVVNQMRRELGLVLRTQYRSERVSTRDVFLKQRLQFKRLDSHDGTSLRKKFYLYFFPGLKTIP